MSTRVDAVGEQTSLADRKRRAGQRLLIGFGHPGTPAPAVTDELRKVVEEIRPAGFVLFRRNIVEKEQIAELNRELASMVPDHSPALICIDQEGGRVQRLLDTRWPSMREVGTARDYTDVVSRAIAREIRAVGFNLNFAPVADVDSNPDNPIIGNRSFGRTPEEVSRHVVSFLKAHQQEGVIACAKHFPGHGDTDLDSHKALPFVKRDEHSLRRTELPPFQAAIDAGVGTVMSAHVVFPAWDDLPATLSSRVIPRLLRGELGYDGVLFSDDMEMKAVAGRFSVEEQVWKATEATVDVLLVCESHDVQLEMFRELVHAQERSKTQQTAAIDAVKRVDALRERFLLTPPPVPDLHEVGSSEYLGLAEQVKERARC